MKSYQNSLLSLAALGIAVIMLCFGSAARADSWAPPERRETLSVNGQFRFTAYPASDGKVRAFHKDEGKSHSAVRPSATGRLERKRARGGWETVWKAPLANLIAPTDALVTDDGRYVVTFDNWYSTGHGENVIVIYRADGSIVRSMTLTDLVPDYYKDVLSHSVSSIFWRDHAELSPNGQVVSVDVFEAGATFLSETSSVRFRIALEDGTVTAPDEPEWTAALNKARRFALDLVRAGLQREHMTRNPITAPAGCASRDWDIYLHEVFERQAPVGSGPNYVSSHIMLPADADDHERRLINFIWAPGNRYGHDQRLALAAPCASDALLAAAKAVAKKGGRQGRDLSRHDAVGCGGEGGLRSGHTGAYPDRDQDDLDRP